jgi:DNA-binding NarL/FixJ family response regulator
MLMPAKTGVEVFYELQERHPALPVILCTAFSPEGTIEELRGRGLAGVLRKPYDLRALRAALARVGVGGVAADGGSSQEKQEQ